MFQPPVTKDPAALCDLFAAAGCRQGSKRTCQATTDNTQLGV
jgi:hypothetical protein